MRPGIQPSLPFIKTRRLITSLPVVFFIFLLFFLQRSEHHLVFEKPMLLAFLNTSFLCIILSFIAWLAARSHYATGSRAVEMLGCGIVCIAASSLVAGWVMPFVGGPNPTVTVHNVGMLFGGGCHVVGAHLAIKEIAGTSTGKRNSLSCYATYLVIVAGIIIISLLALLGVTPAFFDQATGPSHLRQGVLVITIALFTVTGYIFMAVYAATATSFAWWYAHATWLVAVGLAGVFLQERVGDLTCWAGRIAQYLASLYFIAAFFSSKKESRSGSTWVLWPYLEERIRKRTSELTVLNEALMKEIAERTESQRQLKEQEDQLSSMLRSSNDGFWNYDFQKEQFVYSPRWCEMLGYQSGELPSDWNLWRRLMHPDDLERTEAYLRELLVSNADTFEIVTSLRHKAGSYVSILSRGVVTRNEEGAPIRLWGANSDITKRREMEAALLQQQHELVLANEALEQRVLERTSNLEDAIREQEAFCYSISHDLRAPLRHINCYSGVLAEDHSALLSEDALACIDNIRAASSRMGTMIDQLLHLSWMTRVTIAHAEVDLILLAREVIEMYRRSEPQRQVETVVQESLVGSGDKRLLRRLLENIIGNAWKYTATQQNPRIEVAAITLHDETVYCIRDNGVGFDMLYQDKLFKIFHRLHGLEFEGTGMGLANAQRIINRHGGRIWAEGAVGEGATFYFTLPETVGT